VKEIELMPVEQTPARQQVLDRVHLHAQVDSLVVAAIEADFDEDKLLDLVRSHWRDINGQADHADDLAVLHPETPR
jgi:hypothetical protein